MPAAMRAAKPIVACIAGLVALAGCQAAPRLPLMSPLEAGAGYGYAERPLGDAHFEVDYVSPTMLTSPVRDEREAQVAEVRELASDLALWRAAELAAGQGFAAFTVDDRRTDVEVEVIDEAQYLPHYGPYIGRTLSPFGYHGFYDFGPRFRDAWLQVRVTLTITLLSELVEGALDAAQTVEELKQKHPDALLPRGGAQDEQS